MRWRELWDDLTGRNVGRFVEPLRRQAAAAVAVADLLLDAAGEGTLASIDVDRIEAMEEDADVALDEVLTTVSRSLSTPIDREDLFRLSRSLDDVVDNLRDFAVEAHRYGVGQPKRFVAPLRALRVGCEALDGALKLLAGDASALAEAARDAKHANKARDAFHDGMAELVAGDLSMDAIRDRELLRRLDVTGLRLGEAADMLASGALKRG